MSGETRTTPRYEDGTYNYRVSPIHCPAPGVEELGLRDPKRNHSMGIGSAYACAAKGEPDFTTAG